MKKVIYVMVLMLMLSVSHVWAEFVNVTQDVFGVPHNQVTGRTAIAWPDINNDNLPDLFLSSRYFYINNGDGTLTLRDSTGMEDLIGGSLHRATFADADNDGDLDCVLSDHNPTSDSYDANIYYFENTGAPDFMFSGEVIYTCPPNTRGGQPTFVDGNNDGVYEIYLGMFGNWSPDYGIGADQYFMQNDENIWENVTTTYISELGEYDYRRPTRGTIACDYDNDADMDIFVPVYGISFLESWSNILWQNDGAGYFVDVAAEAGVEIEPHGRYGVGLASGASWGDYDNDGDFDLVVGNIHGWAALYRNDGPEADTTFTNVTEEAGLITTGPERQWHNTLWVDYDNDGDLDLFLTQWYDGYEAYLFRNDGPDSLGHFTDVTLEMGFNNNAEFRNVESVAAADYDQDGDMDVVFYTVQSNYRGTYFYRNELDSLSMDNHWLIVKLQGAGETDGLTGLGAQVWVTFPDGSRSGVRQVESSSADQVMNMHEVHFGLAEHDEIAQVRVRWLNGEIEYWTFEEIGGSIDQWITLEQGTGTILLGDISGCVTYQDTGTPVPNTMVMLMGDIDLSTMVDEMGCYLFEDLAIPGTYASLALKEGDVNGISAYDASCVARYAVDLYDFNDYQELAADVSTDGEITAYDASLIAQYAIGLPQGSLTGEWTFTPSFYNYDPLEMDMPNQDFGAVLYGEITGNWRPSEQLREGDDVVSVSVRSEDENLVVLLDDPFPQEITAFEFTVVGDDLSIRFAESVPANWQLLTNRQDKKTWKVVAYGITPLESNELLDIGSNDSSIHLLEGFINETRIHQQLLSTNIPANYRLYANYPNPFNPKTTIGFDVPVSTRVMIEIYDTAGHLIRTLVDETFDAGRYDVEWDGMNDENQTVHSGVYFYRMKTGDYTNIQSMVLLR